MRRRLPMVTGLAGLLVVAATDSVLHEHAVGVISTASAQQSNGGSVDDADVEEGNDLMDEEYVEETDDVEDEMAAEDEPLADEETGDVEDESAADEEPLADEETSWEEEEEEGADGSDSVESENPGASEVAVQRASGNTETEAPIPSPANDAAPVSKRDRAFQAIVESTKAVLPTLEEHVFKPSDRLKDLGANSVDRAEIVMLTMERLAVSIPMRELFDIMATDIGALADGIAAKLP